MSSFLKNIRNKGNPSNSASSAKDKKDLPVPLTPLEKLLLDAPPLKDDGKDRFFGLENFGSTCYGSSILQCLYYSIPFREQVVSFPARTIPIKAIQDGEGRSRLVPTVPFPQTPEQLAKAKAQVNSMTVQGARAVAKPEDKESQEYKKKQILSKGPLWALRYDNASTYGMKESLFTCMKDLFEAMATNQDRMGIIAPYKFYEIMRSSIHETWGGSQHQDAHEFFNLLLNSVADTVEETAKEIEAAQKAEAITTENGSISTAIKAVEGQSTTKSTNARWVHELFQGTLTNETKCLTCEYTSQRDEPFLDLSVDLDAHSSVTACLRRFSQEEMLRERDKFFCDKCGGLQEAERRMKIKKSPKILALHLKRFRYTEDMQRMYKLFHRITYPEQIRLFNTTADSEDPDKIYELYAVVVHIGAGPYHGHYISIIKTQERGWLLFDDELVEPVDKSFVMNFFGDKANLACAYVLFYQETTIEAVRAEQEAEGRAAQAKYAKEAPPVKESHTFGLGLSLKTNGFASHATPTSPAEEPASALPALDHAITAPQIPSATSTNPLTQAHTITSPQSPSQHAIKKKEEKDRKSAEKEAAKAAKAAEKEAKAMKKDEEARQKQAIKSTIVETKAAMEASDQTKKAEKKDTTSRNFLTTLNHQMSTIPTQHTNANGTVQEPSTTNRSSNDNVPNGTTIPQDNLPTQSRSTNSPASPAPNSPEPSQSPSAGLSAFSRFRQSSRSLKHRPKFWPGSSSISNSPVPAASGESASSSPLAPQHQSAAKHEESAVDDSEEGSTTAEPAPTLTTISPSATTDVTGEASTSSQQQLNKKKLSRFSLRRKGSHMLSFSAGSDNK